VSQYFAKRPLRQRVIALFAAYAIALSSLFASFGLARAAAEAATAPDAVICHTTIAGEQAPSPPSDQTDDRHCAANCCVGCLMLLVALPAPPTKVVGVPQSAVRLLALPAIAVAAAGPETTSHQSRAPPPAA
jgi:DUF2946 family protein